MRDIRAERVDLQAIRGERYPTCVVRGCLRPRAASKHCATHARAYDRAGRKSCERCGSPLGIVGDGFDHYQGCRRCTDEKRDAMEDVVRRFRDEEEAEGHPVGYLRSMREHG